jgi:hypothetical protein
MTRRLLLLLAAASLVASAQKDDSRKLRAWFPDGTGLEFDCETTGSTPLPSRAGAVLVNDQGVHRVVSDKDGDTLYAYGVEAWTGPQPGTVTIRIKPLDAETGARLRSRGSGKDTSGPISTLGGVREFPGVRKGQAVRLEILYNPSTGEKVYDILRPSTDVRPNPRAVSDSVPAVEELSFREIALVVNGEKTTAPAGWLTGAVARLYLPGRGAYFLSTYQPKTAQVFRQMVYADRHNLEFAIDGDFIRIASNGNVLTQSESGILWVYHDPKYQPQSQSGAPDLVFADKVESLIGAVTARERKP